MQGVIPSLRSAAAFARSSVEQRQLFSAVKLQGIEHLAKHLLEVSGKVRTALQDAPDSQCEDQAYWHEEECGGRGKAPGQLHSV